MHAQDDGPRPGQPVVEVVLPTYAMKPKESEKFYPSEVRTICHEVLEGVLNGKSYDEELSKEWICAVGNGIKSEMHLRLQVPRYKIIIQVTIGQLKDQGVSVASRCLWDVHLDNYASANFTNTTLWANVMVFGVYTD